MPKYRPKNIEVEAMQFTRENAEEFKEWVEKHPLIPIDEVNVVIERRVNGNCHCVLIGDRDYRNVKEECWVGISDDSTWFIMLDKDFKDNHEPIPENSEA